MEAIGERAYLLPGPELARLISDRVSRLKRSYAFIDSFDVLLWTDDHCGIRKKSCEVIIRFGKNPELHVTTRAGTHILAVKEALHTAAKRISSRSRFPDY